MLATALATPDDLSSSGRRPHCHHVHNHRYNHQQQLEVEPNNTDEEPPAAAAAGLHESAKSGRAGGANRSVHQIQVQLQLQHKQRHQNYVYPKLQLVQIDDAWYALNQTCLQIYQQLQMCGTAQLMPVDVVPLHKLPECVRKSLSPTESDETKRINNRRRSSQVTSGASQTHHRVGSHDDAEDDAPTAANAGDGAPAAAAGNSQSGTLRIYDIMSDSASMAASTAPPFCRHPTTDATNSSHVGCVPAAAGGDKSWWSRFFQGNNGGSNVTPAATGGNATWMASCRRRQPQGMPCHAFRRRHRQIVQKLMEETSWTEEDNRRERDTLANRSDPASPPHNHQPESPDVRRDHETDGQLTCVVCQSVFSSHRLLQRHRERANHFGCTVCCKSFKNWSSLQDHCELLSHWSEEDSDEDSGDDFDSDEYLFSSSDDE